MPSATPLPEEYRQHGGDIVTLGTAWTLTMLGSEAANENFGKIVAEIDDLCAEVASLKLADAELKSALAETRAKADTSDFVLQRLRLENQGDAGPEGKMGRDGAAGPRGERGETGPKGARGQMGDRLVNWRLSPEEFLAFPVNEQGKELPPLNLHPFFAEFEAQTAETDSELATAAAEERRAGIELEIARITHGVSPSRG
jgi:hypothetical protein